jgi:catechol 2,3-dioxygenase-like lactoylglutathione lyase family enzyme
MPAIGNVQVNLFCDDLEACLAFYKGIGLPEVFRAPEGGPAEHIEVEAADTRIGLTSARVANDLVQLGVAASAPPAAEVVFWCEDADRLYAQALRAGGTVLVAPMDSPDGRLRYGWVKDPDGHQVKFVQKR